MQVPSQLLYFVYKLESFFVPIIFVCLSFLVQLIQFIYFLYVLALLQEKPLFLSKLPIFQLTYPIFQLLYLLPFVLVVLCQLSNCLHEVFNAGIRWRLLVLGCALFLWSFLFNCGGNELQSFGSVIKSERNMLGSSIDGVCGSIDGKDAPAVARIVGFFRVYPHFASHYIRYN